MGVVGNWEVGNRGGREWGGGEMGKVRNVGGGEMGEVVKWGKWRNGKLDKGGGG